jgi:cholesterol transport system auxiliary component
MLAPLLVEALERGGRFRAVQSAADVSSPFLLETEIVALQQEYTVQPSVARFALRAQLVDTVERRVLAAEEFEAVEPSPSEDPYGGVVAANRAVARVLGDLARWCGTYTPQPAAPK